MISQKNILQTDSREKILARKYYTWRKKIPTLKKMSFVAYDSGKKSYSAAVVCQEKRILSPVGLGENILSPPNHPYHPRNPTHSPSMSNGRCSFRFLCCSAPLFLACENIRFPSLFAAKDVSRGGRSSSRNVPSDEERGETDVFAGYSVPSLPNVPLFLCSSCFVPC